MKIEKILIVKMELYGFGCLIETAVLLSFSQKNFMPALTSVEAEMETE